MRKRVAWGKIEESTAAGAKNEASGMNPNDYSNHTSFCACPSISTWSFQIN
jgi:hypothetical protein